MSKTKKTLYSILKGGFLVDKDAQKSWGFIIFLTGLALLMIASSHKIDQKVQKIAALNKQKRELRSEFVATRSDLMKLKMESTIKRELEKNGFYTYSDPPKKIKVKIRN
ncbi:MAG: FtsL-like putative cell division protein [Bacteroidota bacterium]